MTQSLLDSKVKSERTVTIYTKQIWHNPYLIEWQVKSEYSATVYNKWI